MRLPAIGTLVAVPSTRLWIGLLNRFAEMTHCSVNGVWRLRICLSYFARHAISWYVAWGLPLCRGVPPVVAPLGISEKRVLRDC